MNEYEIRFVVAVPANISEADVKEWARFECHDNGEMKCANPLCNKEIEPVFGSFSIRRSGAFRDGR